MCETSSGSSVFRNKLGTILDTKGFSEGTQAQMIPTWTSIADHMNDSDAYHEKSPNSD
jgi:hypothetical protein